VNHIQGIPRNQVVLFPEAVEDYIAADNPVRFLDAFVENMNLSKLGFKSALLHSTGRPPYHPADLLKLYLYGYLRKIRSSRKLEAEAQRNIELFWLLKKLSPDFKTIANFRRDNKDALVRVCREFTVVCSELNLYSAELVAIDGSKFYAVNATHKNFTARMLKRKIQELDERIKRYLRDMDEQDLKESGTKDVSAEELNKKIEFLKQRREQFSSLKQDMEDNGEMQRSITDPDSRSMVFGKGCDVGYNVQTAVDSKHHLVVDHDVTNDVTDQKQLSRMAIKAKQTLGVDQLNVVADMGYYDGDEVKTCEENNILVYTEKPNTSANRKKGLYSKDSFHYDSAKDVYICPAKQELTYRFDSTENDRHIRYYAASNCKSCSLRSRCNESQDNKRITRWIHEDVNERMRERVRKWPTIMKLRREIVEHPFGTLKRWWDQGFFLMRGLPNVRAEMSLSILAYNMTRAINIVGVKRLIEAVS
jgi:transposase